jgi:hypothetical protein
MANQPNPPHYDMLMPMQATSFDPVSFDQFIRSNGVTFVHHAAILCPLGVTDRFDARSHAGHPGCTNGFVYKVMGELTGSFSQNQMTAQLGEVGIYDGSTVQVTLPRFYDTLENEAPEVIVQHYDRFYLKDCPANTVTTQRVEAHQSGLDRLQYSATKVVVVMDSNGKEYAEGADFCLDNGSIRWTSGNRPGYDPETGKGMVYSVRYHYEPFYYVKTLIHEVRVCRVTDPMTGEVELVRMPHGVLLQREYAFESSERDEQGNGPSNVTPGPASGSFGAR